MTLGNWFGHSPATAQKYYDRAKKKREASQVGSLGLNPFLKVFGTGSSDTDSAALDDVA